MTSQGVQLSQAPLSYAGGARSRMRTTSAAPLFLFIAILGAGLALAYAAFAAAAVAASAWIAGTAFVLAVIVGAAVQVAAQWDRAVVLRLGRFRALRGPGLFVIVPIVDTIANWIDTRVITSTFKAEKTLTKDTVPVNAAALMMRRRQPGRRSGRQDAAQAILQTGGQPIVFTRF